MSLQLSELIRFLEALAPLELAEEWDNVGLLVGDAQRQVSRVMTCLTLTPATVAEAVREQAGLVVVHHPLPFKPLARITAAGTVGKMLLELIEARVAVYSAHTACDSAADGINQQLAKRIGLVDIEPLVPANKANEALGSGRVGRLERPANLIAVVAQIKQATGASQVQLVGDLERTIRTVAIACGSAGSFLNAAIAAKCELFVTGEASFHTCLEAEAQGIALALAGHYATERFHSDYLAEAIARQFAELHVWASRDERDPIVVV